MISISVCMIVKDEEEVLARCLNSLAGIADEIIIVDTGSGDATKQIAAAYTERIYDFAWVDDFSAARNYSFSKATMEYIYVADADEVIEEGERQKFLKLKRELDNRVEIVQMVYTNQLSCNTTYNFDEELLIADKQAQLAELYRSLNQVSTTVYAPTSGIYSAGTDGWEGVVTPAMLDSLTAGDLDGLLQQQHSPASGSVGKLITDSTWYYAALLDGVDTGLQSGRRYTLSFSGDYFGQLVMTLERVALDGDRTLAIFSCRSHLADTTLLRVQTVDVVTQTLEGIRVPRQALRVETVEETAEDGSIRHVNRYGVFTVVGAQAEWHEVEVLYTDESYYLVRPADPAAASRLRAGDEVIFNSSGIYDGKVVR